MTDRDLEAAAEANRYLLALIVEQAAREGHQLSEIDLHELRTPDCGHTADEDATLDEELPAGYDRWDLRLRAARALRSAYRKVRLEDLYGSRPGNPVSEGTLQAAYRKLRGSPFVLGNLTHADAPVLNAVTALHLRPFYELADDLITLPSSRWKALSGVAIHRPRTVALVLLVAAGAFAATLVVVLKGLASMPVVGPGR